MCFFFFNPGPVRRVPSPNRYTAEAKLCFCKNNKRMIIFFVSVIIRQRRHAKLQGNRRLLLLLLPRVPRPQGHLLNQWHFNLLREDFVHS